MNNSKIKLSTSLFSFALEWNSGKYSLEQMIAKVKELDLGPGIEIIGFQSLKGFPHLLHRANLASDVGSGAKSSSFSRAHVRSGINVDKARVLRTPGRRTSLRRW